MTEREMQKSLQVIGRIQSRLYANSRQRSRHGARSQMEPISEIEERKKILAAKKKKTNKKKKLNFVSNLR